MLIAQPVVLAIFGDSQMAADVHRQASTLHMKM